MSADPMDDIELIVDTVNFPDGLPTPEEVLASDHEATPGFLINLPLQPAQWLEMALCSRAVYYPGSGTDDHAVKLFGSAHAAHCFIHCDLTVTAARVIEGLQAGARHRFAGYQIERQELLAEAESRQLVGGDLPEFIHDGRDRATANPVGGLGQLIPEVALVILRREQGLDDRHGPERLLFVHIHAEAVTAYWKLWGRHGNAPYAVLLQDHGDGGNWCKFGGLDSPLYQAARSKLPRWLMVAEGTDAWPGYNSVSAARPGGMHSAARRLWKID